MNDFTFYFSLGWQHIISVEALDHQLFILALAAIYLLKDWRQVLVLVTAFTLGHSLTLALSVYNILKINSAVVEFLISCTIIVTALFNCLQKRFNQTSLRLNYFLALFFGLIHGLGFANTIRFMLSKNETIGWRLFGFNLGLEAGQIVVVAVILAASFIVVSSLKLNRRLWVLTLSLIALIIGIKLAVSSGYNLISGVSQ